MGRVCLQVAWYRLFARSASGNNVKVRLNDYQLPGTGEEVRFVLLTPKTSGFCRRRATNRYSFRRIVEKILILIADMSIMYPSWYSSDHWTISNFWYQASVMDNLTLTVVCMLFVVDLRSLLPLTSNFMYVGSNPMRSTWQPWQRIMNTGNWLVEVLASLAVQCWLLIRYQLSWHGAT